MSHCRDVLEEGEDVVEAAAWIDPTRTAAPHCREPHLDFGITQQRLLVGRVGRRPRCSTALPKG
jgi:hypothetical protein